MYTNTLQIRTSQRRAIHEIKRTTTTTAALSPQTIQFWKFHFSNANETNEKKNQRNVCVRCSEGESETLLNAGKQKTQNDLSK